MPIYEFKCERCGRQFERLVFTSTCEGSDCPECGSEETRRILSVFSSCGIERALSKGGCSSGSGHS